MLFCWCAFGKVLLPICYGKYNFHEVEKSEVLHELDSIEMAQIIIDKFHVQLWWWQERASW